MLPSLMQCLHPPADAPFWPPHLFIASFQVGVHVKYVEVLHYARRQPFFVAGERLVISDPISPASTAHAPAPTFTEALSDFFASLRTIVVYIIG